jgi:hypothetical protein
MKKLPLNIDLDFHILYSVDSQSFIDIQKDSLLRKSAPQRCALAAVGGRVDAPSKRGKPKATQNGQKTRRVPTVSCTHC